MTKIWAFIEAFPRLVNLAETALDEFRKWKKYQFERDALLLRKEIEDAKTRKDYREVVQSLHDLVSRS